MLLRRRFLDEDQVDCRRFVGPDAIFDYIVEDSPDAAIRVDQEIENQIDLLAQSPELGRPGRVPGTRELVVTRTPYIVAYKLRNDTVEVLRVLHGARMWPDEL